VGIQLPTEKVVYNVPWKDGREPGWCRVGKGKIMVWVGGEIGDIKVDICVDDSGKRDGEEDAYKDRG
jgi:hypothetical protein